MPSPREESDSTKGEGEKGRGLRHGFSRSISEIGPGQVLIPPRPTAEGAGRGF